VLRTLRAASTLLWMKVVTTFYRRMALLSFTATDEPLPDLHAGVPVRFARLSDADRAKYLAFRSDQSAAEVGSRLARGDRCFVAWHGDGIVDAGWVSTDRHVHVPYLGRDLQLEPGDIYYYDTYTIPRLRGHGLYMARNWFAARELRAEGYRRGLALVAVENRVAIAVLQRAGLTLHGTYARLRLGVADLLWSRPSPGRRLPELLPPARSRAAGPAAAPHDAEAAS
jgi:hypothetical protein